MRLTPAEGHRGPSADAAPSWLPGLWGLSPHPQRCIDWNREVLKRELGLTEHDIVDIPQLFSLKDAYAEAFFPDMVRVPREVGFLLPWGPGSPGGRPVRGPGEKPSLSEGLCRAQRPWPDRPQSGEESPVPSAELGCMCRAGVTD